MRVIARELQLTATVGRGSYTFKCYLAGQAVTSSATVRVTGDGSARAPAPVQPVTLAGLAGPDKAYQAYAARQLAALAGAVTRIRADLRGDDLAAARRAWLAAQLDWERVGASYDSFGDAGVAVDGPRGHRACCRRPGPSSMRCSRPCCQPGPAANGSRPAPPRWPPGSR
jgi:high-affinity iron transporter